MTEVMMLFLIIGFILLLFLIFIAYTRNNRNKVVFVNYSNSDNSNKLVITENVSLNPSFQPYEEINYKKSNTPSVFLPMWSEALAYENLVSFGPYFVEIKKNYLEIIDLNNGKHKIDLCYEETWSSRLLKNIKITYSDAMVVKITSKDFNITLARGSPFITIEDKQNLLLKNKNSIIKIDKSNKNTTSNLLQINKSTYNLYILPKMTNMIQLLEINKNIIIENTKISSDGNLYWYTKGSDILLLFIPSYLPSIALETGIEISSSFGSFKLIRGHVWKYEPIINKEKIPLPSPPSINDVRYADEGRYIVLGHEKESYIYVASLAQKLLNEKDFKLAYPLLRYLYGGVLIEKDPLFSVWYSADFYERIIPIIDIKDTNLFFYEKLNSVFTKL